MLTHEPKIAHLGFIQNVINRMGNNSFLLKGWSVALLAASFALAADNAERKVLWAALLPLLVFWWLDAYFLRQERMYRKLYDVRASGVLEQLQKNAYQKLLRAGARPDTLASMLHSYTMDTRLVQDSVPSQLQTAFSKTLLWFHFGMFSMLGIGLGVMYYSAPTTNAPKSPPCCYAPQATPQASQPTINPTNSIPVITTTPSHAPTTSKPPAATATPKATPQAKQAAS